MVIKTNAVSSARFVQPDDTEWEERIVWQRGKFLPDGTFRVVVLTRKDRRALLKEHGVGYVRHYLKQMEEMLRKWGVH